MVGRRWGCTCSRMRVSLLACLYVRVIACHLLNGVQMVSQGTEASVSFCSPGRGHLCWMLAELLGPLKHMVKVPQRAEDPLCLLQGAHFPHFQLRGLKRGPRLLSRCPVERFPGCGGPQITPLALQRSGDGATAGGDVTQRL